MNREGVGCQGRVERGFAVRDEAFLGAMEFRGNLVMTAVVS
jgi:hypothetical protein